MNRREILKAAGTMLAADLLMERSPARMLLDDAQAPKGWAKANPIPPGPFQPVWESIRDNYRAPRWFNESKCGIFIHWGVYAVPAHHNEWYARHMYNTEVQWHTEHFGPPDQFGYKDFIPLFKAERYDPAAWAALFKDAGVRYVVPVAEHHDGFAMWDSALTRWCAGKMGPKRDLLGDLAKAVREQGLIFGVSSHRMEHHTFMYPAAGVKNDQFDPRYADFYGPPVPGNMNDGNASPEFQEDWLARGQELIDKYEPQIIYFDNGVNDRNYDPVKLRLAAYYYNRAAEWQKQVTLTTKDDAYLAGSVPDFEKSIRAPRWIFPGAWQVDDSVGANTWGYTNEIRYRSADSILQELVDIASKGGNLLLNISPKADGTIPEQQQEILHAIGKWLRANGEAIYGSKPWNIYGEGPSIPVDPPPGWAGGSSARPRPELPPKPAGAPTAEEFRFTTNNGTLYAFGLVWPICQAVLRSLAKRRGTVHRVTLLATGDVLPFTQLDDALQVQLPDQPSAAGPYAFKIDGERSLGQL